MNASITAARKPNRAKPRCPLLKGCVPVLAAMLLASSLPAQNSEGPPKSPGGCKWVNDPPSNTRVDPALIHQTFYSKANKTDVGYLLAFPPDYNSPEAKARRYPVIYFLHGGGRGTEYRGLNGLALLRPLPTSKETPAILVFVNGGKMSHYDTPDSKGETAFLELVEHIDKTCRTVADRTGRVVVGNSMGGRAVGRYLFKFPDLLATGVANAGGHQREKPAANAGPGEPANRAPTDPANGGDPTNNTFDNATRYAKRKDSPPIRLMAVVGNQDGNYIGNLEWCAHLARLKIDHELVVIPGTGHAIDWKIKDSDRRVRDFIAESLKLTGTSAPKSDRLIVPKALMTFRGKLLLTEDFQKPVTLVSAANVKPEQADTAWQFRNGKWDQVDGGIRGTILPPKFHPATLHRPIAYRNAVIQVDVRLDDIKLDPAPPDDTPSVSVILREANRAPVAVARLTKFEFFAGKDATVGRTLNGTAVGDDPIWFGRHKMDIRPGDWHRLLIEILGEEMVVTLDGKHPIVGKHALVGLAKGMLSFDARRSASYRNLRIFEALPNPDWEKTKQSIK